MWWPWIYNSSWDPQHPCTSTWNNSSAINMVAVYNTSPLSVEKVLFPGLQDLSHGSSCQTNLWFRLGIYQSVQPRGTKRGVFGNRYNGISWDNTTDPAKPCIPDRRVPKEVCTSFVIYNECLATKDIQAFAGDTLVRCLFISSQVQCRSGLVLILWLSLIEVCIHELPACRWIVQAFNEDTLSTEPNACQPLKLRGQ